MSKRTKKNTSKCDRYIFSLKPMQNQCKFSQTIQVSFCDPSKHRRQKLSIGQKEEDCLDCPVFNKDNNFATPTFILQSEKQHFELQGEKMRTEHQKKMIEYTDEKDSLNLPKPRSKNSFCNVCRQTYEDYLSHIVGENHKKCIKNSNFNKLILDLVDKFDPSQKSALNFSQNTYSTQNDDDVEEISFKPKKKVKKIEQELESPYQPAMASQVLPPNHLNLGHATYFPNNCQGFLPNQNYNVVYPLNNFSTPGFNFSNRPFLQNQSQPLLQNQTQPLFEKQVNYTYQSPQYSFMAPWQNFMVQYQRNSVQYEAICQVNPVMAQNCSQFNFIMNNPSNGYIGNEKEGAFKFHHNGFGQRRIMKEAEMIQSQRDQTNQFCIYQNWRR